MAYTLNRRQRISYTDRFDQYRKTSPTPTNANGFMKDIAFSETPLRSKVWCLWMNRPDINTYQAPIGRTLATSFDVLDFLEWPIGCDIKDQDILCCKTPGHPQFNEFFVVQGFGSARIKRGGRNANCVIVRIKRMLPGPGLEHVNDPPPEVTP